MLHLNSSPASGSFTGLQSYSPLPTANYALHGLPAGPNYTHHLGTPVNGVSQGSQALDLNNVPRYLPTAIYPLTTPSILKIDENTHQLSLADDETLIASPSNYASYFCGSNGVLAAAEAEALLNIACCIYAAGEGINLTDADPQLMTTTTQHARKVTK